MMFIKIITHFRFKLILDPITATNKNKTNKFNKTKSKLTPGQKKSIKKQQHWNLENRDQVAGAAKDVTPSPIPKPKALPVYNPRNLK